MKIRKAIKSDSAKDFSNLFFSNILQKFFGFIREPVTSFFFGVTSPFIAYQILRTAANLFSQFTVGNFSKNPWALTRQNVHVTTEFTSQ